MCKLYLMVAVIYRRVTIRSAFVSTDDNDIPITWLYILRLTMYWVCLTCSKITRYHMSIYVITCALIYMITCAIHVITCEIHVINSCDHMWLIHVITYAIHMITREIHLITWDLWICHVEFCTAYSIKNIIIPKILSTSSNICRVLRSRSLQRYFTMK